MFWEVIEKYGYSLNKRKVQLVIVYLVHLLIMVNYNETIFFYIFVLEKNKIIIFERVLQCGILKIQN